jgi:hypothetical protein
MLLIALAKQTLAVILHAKMLGNAVHFAAATGLANQTHAAL